MSKYCIRGIAIVVALAFIGGAGFLATSAFKPVASPVSPNGASPHQQAFETSQELIRQEQESNRQRRQSPSFTRDLLLQKVGLLEKDLDQARSEFEVAIRRALRTPRQRAEQLLNDLKHYRASEAVFEARAAYSTQTAGYLGAIGAQPLPVPERNPGYLDTLYNDALVYEQSIDSLRSDLVEARLALEAKIGRVQNDFISLQLEFQNIEKTEFENGDRERAACERAINLAKSLGPFLTNELIPDLPVDPTSLREHSNMSDQLLAVTEWVTQARVNSEDALRLAVESQLSSPVFMQANDLVDRLSRGATP